MQALTILCGIVRVKCVALLLGTTGVGLFGIFNSAQLLLATTQLNLRYSAVRDIAQASSSGTLNDAIHMVRRWGMAVRERRGHHHPTFSPALQPVYFR